MKSIQTTINLYSFSELTGKSRQRAIEEHRCFLLDVTSIKHFEYEEDFYSTLEFYENEDEGIIESIEINDYMFFEDGELASVTHYTKTGITEFTFKGQVYVL